MIAILLLLQADPADELRDVLRQLREERAAAYARRRSRSAEIDAARAPVRRLELEISELKLKEVEADKQLGEIQAELGQLKSAAAKDAELAKAVAPELDAAAAWFKDFVRKGIPYRHDDRLARLGDGGTPPERAVRAWAFAQEELRVARSGEAWTADVALPDGRSKPARLFRAGHLLCGFVTEDGLDSGLWDGAWTPGPGEAPRHAVDMLDHRRPPGFLLFPVKGRAGK